jgi:hypothetical protein
MYHLVSLHIYILMCIHIIRTRTYRADEKGLEVDLERDFTKLEDDEGVFYVQEPLNKTNGVKEDDLTASTTQSTLKASTTNKKRSDRKVDSDNGDDDEEEDEEDEETNAGTEDENANQTEAAVHSKHNSSNKDDEGDAEGEEENDDDDAADDDEANSSPEVMTSRTSDSQESRQSQDLLVKELSTLDIAKAVQRKNENQGGDVTTSSSSSSNPTPITNRSSDSNAIPNRDKGSSGGGESSARSTQMVSSARGEGERQPLLLSARNSARSSVRSMSSILVSDDNLLSSRRRSSKFNNEGGLDTGRSQLGLVSGNTTARGGNSLKKSKGTKANKFGQLTENEAADLEKQKLQLPVQERLVVLYGESLHESGGSYHAGGASSTTTAAAAGGGGGGGPSKESVARDITGGEGASGIVINPVTLIDGGADITGLNVRIMKWNNDNCFGDALSLEKGDPLNGTITNAAVFLYTHDPVSLTISLLVFFILFYFPTCKDLYTQIN